ncbi:MAG: hypothetical protein KAI03_04915 [Candidatus Aureabacteria bacterium]|nr:hypothetical protein [Candidatus Auribacterota bacterium]
MKKLCFLLCSLFLINLFNIELTIAQEDNLLLNPSFEDGENRFDPWTAEGIATYIWTQPWHAYKGNWAFSIGNDLEWAYDGSWGCIFQVLVDPGNPQNLFPVIQGDTFTFEMRMMIEKGYKGKAGLKIEFFDYDRRLGFKGKPLDSFRSAICKEKNIGQWLRYRVKGLVPEGTVSVTVFCMSEDMPKGSKYVFFDAGVVTITPALLL